MVVFFFETEGVPFTMHNGWRMNKDEGYHSNRSGKGTGNSRSFRRSPYAVLNLDDKRAIGDDKIRDSYRRLSRLLHPDKRPPGKERDDAQELFIELQHACKHSAMIFLNVGSQVNASS